MNTRSGTLAEGIANNAVSDGDGLTEVEQVRDEDLQIGLWRCSRTTPRIKRRIAPGSRGAQQAEIADRFAATAW